MRGIPVLLRLTAVLLIPLVSGCIIRPGSIVRGSGNLEEEIRPIGSIETLRLETIADVYIQTSENIMLRVQGDDNVLPFLITDYSENTLTIRSEPGTSFNPSQPLRVYLWIPELDQVYISSTGDVHAETISTRDFHASLSSTGFLQIDELRADSITLDCSSTGNINISNLNSRTAELETSSTCDIAINSFQAESVDAELSSSGSIELGEGHVLSQVISLSSTGSYLAAGIDSTDVAVALSSTGSAEVTVSGTLTAQMTGTGDLFYSGSPALDIKNTGVGEVLQLP